MVRSLRWVAALALVLGLAVPAVAQDTQPPPHPATMVVQPNPTLRLNDVVFRVTFSPSLDPPSNQPVPTYLWGAGFSDGQAGSGTIAASAGDPLNWDLNMPYHVSGQAQIGFVCLRARDAAGNLSVDQACGPVPVPAKPVAVPNTATVRLTYTEPSTNQNFCNTPVPTGYINAAPCATCTPVVVACCTGIPAPPGALISCFTVPPLDDLKLVRAYYSIDGGPQQEQNFLASRPQGGGNMVATFTVGTNVGTLALFLRAIDLTGNESVATATISTNLIATIPHPPTTQFNLITQ